jgi:hypothetical protein
LLNKAKAKGWKLSLLEAIKSKDEFPSLPNLQFFMWSVVIAFAFLTVYIIRVSGGVFEPPSGILPENILKLFGISAVVPAASIGLNHTKYGPAHNAVRTAQLKKLVLDKNSIAARFSNLEKGWSSILLEGGSSSITRLQMFLWTWVSIFVYLMVFFGALYTLTLPTSPTLFDQVVLPDVDPTIVLLMGISQGSFVAGKVTTAKFS